MGERRRFLTVAEVKENNGAKRRKKNRRKSASPSEKSLTPVHLRTKEESYQRGEKRVGQRIGSISHRGKTVP